jgi:hypothetical protein
MNCGLTYFRLFGKDIEAIEAVVLRANDIANDDQGFVKHFGSGYLSFDKWKRLSPIDGQKSVRDENNNWRFVPTGRSLVAVEFNTCDRYDALLHLGDSIARAVEGTDVLLATMDIDPDGDHHHASAKLFETVYETKAFSVHDTKKLWSFYAHLQNLPADTFADDPFERA